MHLSGGMLQLGGKSRCDRSLTAPQRDQTLRRRGLETGLSSV